MTEYCTRRYLLKILVNSFTLMLSLSTKDLKALCALINH